jgi:hypothetical protein
MCTGLEIPAAIAIGSAVVGGITKAIGDKASGDASADQARRQAAIDDANQKLADDFALKSTRDAEVTAGQIGDAGARLVAKQRVAAVSQGVDPTTGSAAQAEIGTAEITAEQKSSARLQGAWDAYGYKSQGAQFGRMAAAHRASAADFERAGTISAISDLVGGAASASSSALHWWAPTPKGKG